MPFRHYIIGLITFTAFNYYLLGNTTYSPSFRNDAQIGVSQEYAHHLEDDNITVEDLMYKYKSDKSRDDHGYTKLYDMLFGPIRHTVMNITEVGIAAGQSIQAWYRYFPNAEIHGIDIKWHSKSVKENMNRLKPRFHGHIVNVLKGKTPIQLGFVPESMDIIIEDGPHWAGPQIDFLVKLFPLVKPGGYYIIEDISQKMGGAKAFHEQPKESLPPAALEILEGNDALWIDASSGHRAWDEWARVSPNEVQDRTHHNSYCLVIKKRDRPLKPMQINFGAGAMDPGSIIKEDITEQEVEDFLKAASE